MKLIFPLLLLLTALPISMLSQEISVSEAKAAFEAADRELNLVYEAARKTIPEWRFDTVQDEQREWIEYRDGRADAAAVYNGGGAEGEQNAAYWESMKAETETRIQILQGWMKIDDFEKEWEGVWRDGYGGRVQIIEEAPDQVRFSIHVVRGPTYHLGILNGTAERNGSQIRFSISEEGLDGETWLTFIKGNDRMEIFGENTSHYHGARAYFTGKYIRIRNLTEQDRDEVLNPEY